MRFEDVLLCKRQIYSDWGFEFDYELPSSKSLVKSMNYLRYQKGNKDLVGKNNGVSYTFYLSFHCSTKEVSLCGVCNNGEKDAFEVYDINLSESEKNTLVWKALIEMATELRRNEYAV